MPELYVETGPMEGQAFLLSAERPTLLIGRSDGGVQVDADLAPYGGAVSRRHAKVRLDPHGGVFVTDLGSRNGTLINDLPLPEGTECELQLGARLHIAPPDGPCMIFRQRAMAWDGATEELEFLRRELRELRSAFDALRRERDELASRGARESGQSDVAVQSHIDWTAIQRSLVACRTPLQELRTLFVDHQLDGRALSLLMKIQAAVGELGSLLSRE